MSELSYILIATVILFLTIFITRALPFLFAKQMHGNRLFQYLGTHLPMCIIFLLVVYYIMSMSKPTHWSTLPWHLLALAVTLLVHWWRRNMLLSLITGTAVFLGLNYLT